MTCLQYILTYLHKHRAIYMYAPTRLQVETSLFTVYVTVLVRYLYARVPIDMS